AGEDAAAEESSDRVLRDPGEPPADERQAAALVLRVGDVELRRIAGIRPAVERRVPVGTERRRRVERDAPRPPEDADVVVEERARVAAGEEQHPKAPNVASTKPTQRKARRTMCGSASSHLTSQRHRESGSSSEPSTDTGYVFMSRVCGPRPWLRNPASHGTGTEAGDTLPP